MYGVYEYKILVSVLQQLQTYTQLIESHGEQRGAFLAL